MLEEKKGRRNKDNLFVKSEREIERDRERAR